MPAAWVAAIGAVVNTGMQADSADKASSAQQGASKESMAAQKSQFDLTRRDSAPFLATGTAANKRLGTLLGIGDQPTVGGTAAYKMPTFDDILNYNEQAGGPDPYADARKQWAAIQAGEMGDAQGVYQNFKDRGYDLKSSLTTTGGTPDASYGSLLKKFSQADLDADPVYKSGLEFGLKQGSDAIDARAVATGNYDSGATLKALTRYGNDYGSTKAEGAYNRYNADNTNIFNKLSGVSGTGQVAANQVATAGTAATNQISNDINGAGNARAAGIVGGANAWGTGVNNAVGAYNTYDANQRYKALTNNAGNYTSSGTYAPAYSGYSADGSYAYG